MMWRFVGKNKFKVFPLPACGDKSAGLPIWTQAVRAKPEGQDVPSHWARVRGIKIPH